MATSPQPGPYEILGLEPGASQDEVRRAFRKLAREHHPDSGGNGAIFRLIVDAYETLKAGAGTEAQSSGSTGVPPDESTTDGTSKSASEQPDGPSTSAADSSADTGAHSASQPASHSAEFVPPAGLAAAPVHIRPAVWHWQLLRPAGGLAAWLLLAVMTGFGYAHSSPPILTHPVLPAVIVLVAGAMGLAVWRRRLAVACFGLFLIVLLLFWSRIPGWAAVLQAVWTCGFPAVVVLRSTVFKRAHRRRTVRVPRSYFADHAIFGTPGPGLSPVVTAHALERVLPHLPAARVVHAIPTAAGQVDHALILGYRAAMVFSFAGESGHYSFDHYGTIMLNQFPYVRGGDYADAAAAAARLLPSRCTVATWVIINPTDPGGVIDVDHAGGGDVRLTGADRAVDEIVAWLTESDNPATVLDTRMIKPLVVR